MKNRSPLLSSLAGWLLAGLVQTVPGRPATEPWAGFRGPDVAGASTETWTVDEPGKMGLAVVWKTKIGSAYSGIAVAEGKAITMYAEGSSDVLAAFDVDDGRRVWSYAVGKAYPGHDGSHDGPVSTPLAAGGRAFGLGPRGRLFAVELETGREVWSTDLVRLYGIQEPAWGFGASPILEDGVLIVEIGGEGTAIGGFDPATGKSVWTAGSDTVGYQTPVPVKLLGRRQVVAAADRLLFGLDPENGDVLWQHEHGGSGGAGALSIVPVAAEDDRLLLAHRVESSVMVELRREQDGVAVASVWEGEAIRNSYNVPVYDGGYLYAYSSRFLTCVDARTGESRWRSRRPGDGFLILVDGRLVIVTKAGTVHVAEASPEGYVELAGRQVFDQLVWTSPSFADGSIYARSLGEIARVEARTGAAHPEVEVAKRSLPDSLFVRFLAEVEAAGKTEKKALVDRFLAAQQEFPIVDGESWAHFLYRGPAADVALAGEMFGARWEEPMSRVAGTDLFYYSLELKADARVSYVVIEDFREIPDPLNPRRTATAILTRDMEMSFSGEEYEMSWLAMPKWRQPPHLDEAPEAVRGRLESHRLESAGLGGEVDLEVYVPRGYDDAEGRRYPVVYVHGEASTRQRSRIPNSLDNLIGKTVEPVLVAFVSPEHYPAFAEELVPWIDERYRTDASPEGRANVGVGWSGFPALLSTLRRGDLFGKVALQSLFLFTRMDIVLAPLVEGLGEEAPEFYMDWGTYDLRSPHEPWGMVAANREFVAKLRRQGIEVAGGEAHDGTGWSSWRNRTDRVFEALFPLR